MLRDQGKYQICQFPQVIDNFRATEGKLPKSADNPPTRTSGPLNNDYMRHMKFLQQR